MLEPLGFQFLSSLNFMYGVPLRFIMVERFMVKASILYLNLLHYVLVIGLAAFTVRRLSKILLPNFTEPN